jgi:hypothetical protein
MTADSILVVWRKCLKKESPGQDKFLPTTTPAIEGGKTEAVVDNVMHTAKEMRVGRDKGAIVLEVAEATKDLPIGVEIIAVVGITKRGMS